MKIFSVTATWDDGDHEMSSVVSTHATKESADEALATAERSPEAESDLVRYAVEELELEPTSTVDSRPDFNQSNGNGVHCGLSIAGVPPEFLVLEKILRGDTSPDYLVDFNIRSGVLSMRFQNSGEEGEGETVHYKLTEVDGA